MNIGTVSGYCEELYADGGDAGTGGTGDDGGDEPIVDDIDSSSESYGDDPALDALWDDCENGDFDACDELYLNSPFGSAYEEFGDTCGRRNEPQGYCKELYG